MAAERRITLANYVLSKSGKKVFVVTDSVGAVCAGMISDMQNLVREVGVYTKLKELEVKRTLKPGAVAKLMSVLMFERRFAPFITQVILGGIDDKPKVYVLDPLGSVITDDYAAVGTGAEMAVGVIEAGYTPSMSLQGRQGAPALFDEGGDRQGLDERQRHRHPHGRQVRNKGRRSRSLGAMRLDVVLRKRQGPLARPRLVRARRVLGRSSSTPSRRTGTTRPTSCSSPTSTATT